MASGDGLRASTFMSIWKKNRKRNPNNSGLNFVIRKFKTSPQVPMTYFAEEPAQQRAEA